ncbi:protein translocase subunit SecD [Streptomyces sp. NBC_01754]|uniref:protein translocase subunit SecD n=1 Tax=Streptomyces sp. NBC_01754 TaxID=2975930 RepID=UPI002DD957CE|nr:protein translocase subunit SecD [Streptomyces sp. NBC_01754]WSC91498.1 protein translocase subunit SecD [Streptomyces sp. NBC_01754]
MPAPKKGKGRAGGQSGPGRALALILIAMVALTGGMFWSGQTTPRLGIDLAGGTSITLQAKNQPGKPNAINKTNMDTAVSIIERRVNGLGVSEAEVQTQGDRNIIVNIPKGTDSKQAQEQVGTTAQLYFRPVLTVAAGGPTPTGSASPSATGSGKPGTAPSAEAGSGEKASGSQATPSASATTQGRAVTGALKEDATPAPSDSSGTSETPDPATAALEKRFTELDCTDPAARAAAGDGVKPEDPTVACGSEGEAKYLLGPAEVSGTDVDSAKAAIDQTGAGQWIVQMDFTDAGAKKFQKITTQLAQQQEPQNQFAIALDGEVVSAPSVRAALSSSAEISGSFNQQSAQDLANVLSYGALPLSFQELSVTTVSAALGGDQLQAGLIAGAIGLALVVIYLVAYYRGLAFIALISLGVSGVLSYTIMALLGPAIGFALNLPAVCGAIVAIGITADSFIVYFERVRDEIREGRTLRPAIERGWPRARRTILVSDFVSFLAAAVLFLVTVGKVQGFAFTLGLTTLLDVVVVFLFTKPVLTMMGGTKFFASGHPWSGLDPKRLGAKPPLRRSRRVNAPIEHPKEA